MQPRSRSGAVLISMVLAGIVLMLLGCGSPAVTLWTDRSEVAPIVELWNAEQDEYVIELVFQRDVSRALRLEPNPADVVITSAIEDTATTRLFRSLDRAMRKDIDPNDFYAPLLASGARAGRQYLLPVSFNFPLIYSTGFEDTDTILISPEEMRARSAAFAEIEEGRASRLGFSPLWDRTFLYELVRLSGFQVSEASDGAPEWSLDALLTGVNAARQWIDQANGGYAVDTAFQEKYLYNPIIRLVQEGRVLFGFDRSDTFFQRSDLARQGLAFRWLGAESSVLALEDAVYAGIPDGARNRAGAEAFMSWFFTPETQLLLLETNEQERVDSFGVVGGFSSLWRVTERFLPEFYPSLEARIPPAQWIDFPPPSPRHWQAVVEEVVEPWLVREVANRPQSRDLAESIRAWLLQQED